MKKNTLVAPVLKWVGGKRRLIEDIIKLIPDQYTTCMNPFWAAVLFYSHFSPKGQWSMI